MVNRTLSTIHSLIFCEFILHSKLYSITAPIYSMVIKIRSEAANKGPVAVIDMFTCLHSYHRKEYVNKKKC